MKRLMAVTVTLALFLLSVPLKAGAVDPPHYNPASGFTCATCHTGQLTLGSTGYNNACLTCHRPGDPQAGINPLTLADQADPFKNHSSSGVKRIYQTSHRWDGSDIVPAAGAQLPLQGAMTSSSLRARSGNALACVRCHTPHFNTNGSFLRVPNTQDQLCLDCHRSRNVSTHLKGSHPVNINYNSAAGAFNKPPLNSNPANPTSDLSSRLAITGGNLVCSTCHGVHFTDSRSSTVDGRANFANLSSSDGFLLRTDRRGAAVASGQPDQQNLCSNCHAGKKSHNLIGQDIQCSDCHGAHVEFDPNDPTGSKGTNLFLIRRNIITKAGFPRSIFFRYTGSMREYKNAQGTGVCQGCHDVPAPGTGNAPPEHASTDPKVCNTCHFHNSINGSFSGSCVRCHGNPPTIATPGGPNGLATPATNASPGPGAHWTHVKTRGMSCNACHNGYGGKTMPSNTVDMGFAVNAANVPGFTGSVSTGVFTTTNNLNAPYTMAGAAGTAGANQTCSAVYCHGATLTGGSITAPSWIGTSQALCGSCHGSTSAAPPTTAGHLRHAGSGAAGRLGLSCSMCHGAVTDATHVNGSVSWNMAALGATAQYKTPAGTFSQSGTNGSIAPSAAYGQCANLYCHSNVQGNAGVGSPTIYGQPAWGGAALTCGSCHKDMATDGTATGSHVRHTQAAGLACVTCHSGMGRDTASHADGVINLAFSGAAAGTTYTKGAAFAPGKGYGSCGTSYCHGATLPPSNPPRPAPSWNTPFPAGGSVLGDGISGGSKPGSGSCAQCHGYPPQNGHATSGCSGCHTNLNSDNLTFNAPSLHMNGTVDVVGGGGACDACHGYPPASVGFSGVHNNWSSARTENYPGGGGAHTIQSHISKLAKPSEGFSNCSKCHAAADHRMSPVAFTPSQNIRVSINQSFRFEAARQARYTSNRLDGGAHLTGGCSNISCHYGATPKWDPNH